MARFLWQPINEWPIKSAKEIAVTAKEAIVRLQKKAFTAVMTSAQSKCVLEDKAVNDKVDPPA